MKSKKQEIKAQQKMNQNKSQTVSTEKLKNLIPVLVIPFVILIVILPCKILSIISLILSISAIFLSKRKRQEKE